MLTILNIDDVANLLQQLLTGKRYAFVAANEDRGFKPEVRTGQRLESDRADKPSITVYRDDPGNTFAGFNVSDTDGVWGCSTSLREDEYDPTFKNPYIIFENDKVTIIHCAQAGNKLYWVIAVEPEK
ncbi:MAG: hypothetical protein WC242_03885 [Candidatus Paceibacterota bacterium]